MSYALNSSVCLLTRLYGMSAPASAREGAAVGGWAWVAIGARGGLVWGVESVFCCHDAS